MARRGAIGMALACAVWGAGCGPPPAPGGGGTPSPAPTGSPGPEPASRTFYLGRIPYFTATEVVRGADGLLKRLATGLGYDRVAMVLAPDYEGVRDLLLDRKVDAAWLGTEVFRDARARGQPLEALVVPARYGRTWYEGVIVARADSGIAGLKDLRGKRVAFVDRFSSSGYVAPKALLEKAGIQVPGDLATRVPGEPDFLSRHDNVVNAVYFGRADAGAVYQGAVADTFARDPARAVELVEIARTGRIVNEPVVVRADLPAETKKRIADAFLGLVLGPEEQHLFRGADKFVPFPGDP